MKIRDAMNINFARIRVGSTMAEAAEIAARSQASDLMVVDSEDRFIGVLSEGDLIRAIMPSFEDMMSSGGGFSGALETFAQQGRSAAAESIDSLVITNPILYSPQDDLVKAAGTMVAKQIRRLPVVEDGRIVGIVSRADIASSVLRA